MLAIAVLAAYGVMQAALYMKTRRLWACIGTHIAWNYCVSQVFSSTVSGHAATDGLLRGELVGNAMLTGGVFGVEGSLIALLLIGATAAFWLRRAFARQAYVLVCRRQLCRLVAAEGIVEHAMIKRSSATSASAIRRH